MKFILHLGPSEAAGRTLCLTHAGIHGLNRKT
jgi:hypothetical protein